MRKNDVHEIEIYRTAREHFGTLWQRYPNPRCIQFPCPTPTLLPQPSTPSFSPCPSHHGLLASHSFLKSPPPILTNLSPILPIGLLPRQKTDNQKIRIRIGQRSAWRQSLHEGAPRNNGAHPSSHQHSKIRRRGILRTRGRIRRAVSLTALEARVGSNQAATLGSPYLRL